MDAIVISRARQIDRPTSCSPSARRFPRRRESPSTTAAPPPRPQAQLANFVAMADEAPKAGKSRNSNRRISFNDQATVVAATAAAEESMGVVGGRAEGEVDAAYAEATAKGDAFDTAALSAALCSVVGGEAAIAGGLAPFLKAQRAACEKDTYTKDDAQALAGELAGWMERSAAQDEGGDVEMSGKLADSLTVRRARAAARARRPRAPPARAAPGAAAAAAAAATRRRPPARRRAAGNVRRDRPEQGRQRDEGGGDDVLGQELCEDQRAGNVQRGGRQQGRQRHKGGVDGLFGQTCSSTGTPRRTCSRRSTCSRRAARGSTTTTAAPPERSE